MKGREVPAKPPEGKIFDYRTGRWREPRNLKIHREDVRMKEVRNPRKPRD